MCDLPKIPIMQADEVSQPFHRDGKRKGFKFSGTLAVGRLIGDALTRLSVVQGGSDSPADEYLQVSFSGAVAA